MLVARRVVFPKLLGSKASLLWSESWETLDVCRTCLVSGASEANEVLGLSPSATAITWSWLGESGSSVVVEGGPRREAGATKSKPPVLPNSPSIPLCTALAPPMIPSPAPVTTAAPLPTPLLNPPPILANGFPWPRTFSPPAVVSGMSDRSASLRPSASAIASWTPWGTRGVWALKPPLPSARLCASSSWALAR